VFYEPHRRDLALLPHDPFKAIVAPRPVGWISTRGERGEVNVAPYSFFNAVCDQPPMVAFSSAGLKDSAAFAIETGEFVWNLSTYDLREEMNTTSTPLPRGESEFEQAQLEMASSRVVRAPRVAASPCALECRVVHSQELLDLGGAGTDRYLIVGQVVGVHIADEFINEGRVDTVALQPLARLGYRSEYAVVESMFEMPRPYSVASTHSPGRDELSADPV
jgi:flavin reductase (DIM6/NTAB) family NADH-FMN oxidoreductase RutF